MAKNPFYNPAPPEDRPATYQHLARVVSSHLKARASDATVPDADLRRLHPLLQQDAVWQRVVALLGL